MNSNVNFYFLDGNIRQINLEDTTNWKTNIKNITQQTSYKVQYYNLYDINSGYCITKTLNHFKNYHWDRNSNIQIILSENILRILDVDIQYKPLQSCWNVEEMEKRFLTDFINNRIKKMAFISFQEEMEARQLLADCEMHTTKYVESRIWDYEIEDLNDEIHKRIKLEECEKINSKFVQKRIKSYMGKIHPKEELEKRQIMSESEKHTSYYVQNTKA